MTSFKDIIKSSIVDSFGVGDITFDIIVIALACAVILGLYLFLIYFLLERKSFYNMNFNLSLVGMTVITAAIVLTIQTNLVLSLGMVGALSIVRFRSAVKDQMDLFFLFWALANGIMCGARQYLLAFCVSLVLTVILWALSHVPVFKAPYVLVVNGSREYSNEIDKIMGKYCRNSKVRSKQITEDGIKMIVEIKARDNHDKILEKLTEIDGVSASILTYEGDIVC